MDNNFAIKDNRSTYPGGKGGAGVYQNIINLIPPHMTYIETHLGGGSIFKNKRPSPLNILIDVDAAVIDSWLENYEYHPGFNSIIDDMVPIFINTDANCWLKDQEFNSLDFIYVYPPYLLETRKGGKIYDHEMIEQDHIELLTLLKEIPANIMISGYWSSLYNEMLPGWNTHNFQAQTRQGTATEWVWYNYPTPTILHDYSFIGSNFRERERIKKKMNRWSSRLLRMPDLERNAMMRFLNKVHI